MDGYMVVYTAVCDDIPLGLFADPSEANRLASEVEDYYVAGGEGTDHHHAVKEAFAVVGRDIGTFQCVWVAEFKGGKLNAWFPPSDDADGETD